VRNEPSYLSSLKLTKIALQIRHPPKQIRGYARVNSSIRRGALNKYREVLSSARDEKPLQRFFEDYPSAPLVGIVRPHTGFVLPRQILPKPEGGLNASSARSLKKLMLELNAKGNLRFSKRR
jgi:hypothetical protein